MTKIDFLFLPFFIGVFEGLLLDKERPLTIYDFGSMCEPLMTSFYLDSSDTKFVVTLS